jgi:hypothetical protein
LEVAFPGDRERVNRKRCGPDVNLNRLFLERIKELVAARQQRRAGARLRSLGAVAFSRTGDPATGDFSDAKVIRKFGDVPDDLSAL